MPRHRPDREESGEAPRGERGTRWVWWLAAGLVAALLGARFAPRLQAPFAPRPVAAYVALEAVPGGVATDGPHALDADRPFRLHAVLEAETFSGGRLWYSEAPALRLGGREVPAAAIRPWPEGRVARVRWLTVEGFAPYLEASSGADLDRFRFVENFHAEWGSAWTVEGVVDPRLAVVDADLGLRPFGFGVQRWAVRIELYEGEPALTPKLRVASPGAAELVGTPPAVTSLVATLPAPLAALSAAFGRPQLALGPGLRRAEVERAERLVAAGLAARGDRLLAAHLTAAGRQVEELSFATVELGPDGPVWGARVAPGDLLRAGGRVVVAFRDSGVPGRLDPADLVFDFERGLRVQALDRLFVADGGRLRLDLAPLAPPPLAVSGTGVGESTRARPDPVR